MTSIKNMWKKWIGSQADPNRRITYANEAEDVEEAVGSSDSPPSAPARTGSGGPPTLPHGTARPTVFDKQFSEPQSRTALEEEQDLMTAIALSKSTYNEEEMKKATESGVTNAVCAMDSMQLSIARAETLSEKYWKEGGLDTQDQLCDGFFDVYGDFPELGLGDSFPSQSFLSSFRPMGGDPREVVVVDRERDAELRRVEELAGRDLQGAVSGGMIAGVRAVAKVVANHMGGPASDDSVLSELWSNRKVQLRARLHPSGHGGLLVPLGSVCPGLGRHRALLFKFLADSLCIPCEIRQMRSSDFVDDILVIVILKHGGQDLMVDLMRNPGSVSSPEDWYATNTSGGDGWASTSGQGDACYPSRLTHAVTGPETQPGDRQGAGSRFMDDSEHRLQPDRSPQRVQSLPIGLPHGSGSTDDVLSTGSIEREGPVELPPANMAGHVFGPQWVLPPRLPPQQGAAALPPPGGLLPLDLHRRQLSQDLIDLSSPLDAKFSPFIHHSQSMPSTSEADLQPTVRPLSPLRNRSPRGARAANKTTLPPPQRPTAAPPQDKPKSEGNGLEAQVEFIGHVDLPLDSIPHGDDDTSSSSSSDEDEFAMVDSTPGHRVWEPITDCLIDMNEVTMLQRLGTGSFGEVHRAEWQGTEVAVKQFFEQQMTDAVQQEFLQEVRIMKDLRHPNIVQFMGATWKPRGIVMQYMPRGSLFRILHRNPKGKRLHLHRRLRMALDIALGMRYLHSRKPMIVHRDLKSPNLLVARDWTVRLCDFGLSKLKSNTFLSTKSSGGTPEWMAPEVLRNEPANEKSDVYSFAVILWELMFLSEPWQGTRPMQVVFAVGNNNQRLPMPHESPLNLLIENCWAADPEARPSFDEIYVSLKDAQQPISSNFEGEGSGSAVVET